jgi:tetratricopeptide (TPR) repeat protein
MTRALTAAAGIAGLAIYALAVGRLNHVPHPSMTQEMQVALPRFVQVMMTGGDRYLAANIATWRSLVASTEKMQRDNFAIQGRLQADAAWFNPAQEDNYYVAAAILPWYGELNAAQYVLRRAGDARPFDWQPLFYYGFNIYHFQRDPVAAADWLRKAARQARLEEDAYVLENIAVSWYEKGYKPEVALKVVETMAAGARSGGFKQYLGQRAQRLRSLMTLQDAAARYQELRGQPIRKLSDLVDSGLVAAIPADPFGIGFDVGQDGKPKYRTTPMQQKP